jgi:hypothetical protein
MRQAQDERVAAIARLAGEPERGRRRGSASEECAAIDQPGHWRHYARSVGLIIGVGSALAFSRVLAQYLYETRSTDPTVYFAVGALVLAAGSLACLGPARRATSIDPLTALRSE